MSDYVNNTLNIITIISSAGAVLFLIWGGYQYITSTGNPIALGLAKKTIRNAFIGLVLVLSANVLVSVFKHSIEPVADSGSSVTIDIPTIETVEPSDGLTQVLIDAIAGLIQNIVESSTSPIVDGVISYLTTTPTLLNNSVVRKLWSVSLGIVDSLFVLVVALTGLQLMSASVFGFEETEFRKIISKLGIAFLGANVSLFLFDYAVITCNTLVTTVLDLTGGLNHTWVENAIDPTSVIIGATPLIILVFLILFLIVSIVLLLMYVSRLIMLSLAAVLSPFVFLFAALPRFSSLAFVSIKTYLVSVFTVFVHVVIIQLAGSFLTLPEHSENSLVSIAVAIGLFATLIKTPSLMMQLVLHTSKNGMFKKLGTQVINVISTKDTAPSYMPNEVIKTPRKVIY